MEIIDLTGKTFGRLSVVKRNGSKYGKPAWLCQCNCGNTITIASRALASGNTKSCGCLKRELQTKHSLCDSPEYKVWIKMRNRCNNPKNDGFATYGGRGIKVCSRWNDFKYFISDMGERPTPKHQIDRINNDDDYSPENCRWVLPNVNARNRSTTKISLDDASLIKTMLLYGLKYQYIADLFGVSESHIAHIKKGNSWSDAAPLGV